MTTTLTRGAATGTPVDRIDGRLKVSGAAQYAADTNLQHAAYAVFV
ncbi:MAG: hypothetical protein JO349_09525, partial [Candidatus Eremiobacteraeota bacterium]|nr:hypothetical protein [Candidatus Eremiobacteraeota bacterium]